MKLRFNHDTHILYDAEDGQHIAELCDGVHATVGAGIAAAVNAVDTPSIQLVSTQLAHSPTPWVLRDETGDERGGFDIDAWGDDGTVTVAQCADRADAEFIVKACNGHDSLVAALDAARSVLADAGCELTVMNQIDEALAAVGR